MPRYKAQSLVEIGVALAIAGLAVKLALAIGIVLHPFANLALLAGIVIAVIGLVSTNRR